MIDDFLAECREKVSLNFQNSLKERSKISDAMLYTSLAPSKCLRAGIVFATSKIENILSERSIVNIATAIESLHSYSLIHDDLPAMDNDDLRRGIPSNHIKYGEATAILAGDALQAFAFQLIAGDEDLSDSHKIKIISEISNACGFKGMVLGQQMDLDAENEPNENIEEIHALKTGKLIRSSFITTLQDENTIKFLSPIAEQVGLAFQIIDDVLETTNPKDLGKNSESDIRNNKLTYVTQFGLEKAVTDAELIIKKANLQLENKIKNDDALNKLSVILNYIIERKN